MSEGSIAGKASTSEVWRCLQSVTDPELDESIVDLGFVTRVETDDFGRVKVAWLLPTHWCAINFAFLMADDMRGAVRALSWVRDLELVLCDHMAAAEINTAMRDDKTFSETFGLDGGANLEGIRERFLIKAFERRQGEAIEALLAAGWRAESLLALTVPELGALRADHDIRAGAIDAYLARRARLAAIRPALAVAPLAFVDADGCALRPEALRLYRRRLALVSLNTEINGTVCRHLLATRTGVTVEPCPRQATLRPMP
jgi:metal-sulfur cluster biosynthetic enzyme